MNPCPDLTADQADSLRKSLSDNGYLAGWPVVRSAGPAREGELIDGFHRTAFCEELGIEPVTVFQPCETDTEFQILQILANVQRRQLTTAQRAILGAKLLPLYEQRARERQNLGTPVSQGEAGRSAHLAAESVGISGTTLKQMKAVLESARAEELFDAIESGQKSVKAAYQETRAEADGKTYRPPAPKPEKETRRPPLPEQAKAAGWEFRKAVERLERIHDDDRFDTNADQLRTHLLSHLTYALDVCERLAARLQGESS